MNEQGIRVLHIANDVTGKGNGIVNAMVDIACFQKRQGLTVAVASNGGEHESLLAREGVKHFTLDQRRTPAALLRAAIRFRRIVAEYQPNIVHCHMMTGMLLARALRGQSGYRLVSHIQNVHQRSSIVMGLAERVIPVATAVADRMAGLGVPRGKMRVVGNFTLGSARVPPLAAIPAATLRQPAIVTVAGMYKRKGIAELIRAFSELADEFPNANLYLVGNGPDRPAFEDQAAACKCAARIHFEGFQPVPQAYMKAASVFVLASHRESFGIVLGEAREAGCAIVASDVDGIPEALDDGKAGILIPPGNVAALRDVLRKLLADGELRAKWSHAATQGLKFFTAEFMAREVTKVYLEIFASSPERVRGILLPNSREPAHNAGDYIAGSSNRQ